MSNQPQFDTKAFVHDYWPGAVPLKNWFAAYGVDLEKQAVYKWLLRESIPSEYFALMLALLEVERGAPVSLAKYVK